jgi:uncharacterized protein YoxC
MPGTNVGSVFFDITGNSKPFYSAISQAASRGQASMGSAMKKIGGLVAGAFSVAAVVAFGKTCVDSAKTAESAYKGLESILNGTGKSVSAATGFLKDFTADGLVPMTNAVQAYKNLAAHGYDTTQIENVMSRLKDSAAFGRQSAYSYGDAITSATEGLKNENSILVDNAGVTKNVAKMWEDYAKSIGKATTALTKQEKIQAEVAGITEETKWQMGDAAKYANTFAGRMAQLSAVGINIKTSFGNIGMAIADKFLPYIQAAADGLLNLVNRLAAFLAALGMKIPNVTSSVSDVGSAAATAAEQTEGIGDAAAAAAKKAKKAFAAFDEINVLNTSDDASGSSAAGAAVGSAAGSAAVTSSIGAVEQTESALGVALERIKKLLESSNFEGVGATLATSLNEQIYKLLYGTDWDGVSAKINEKVLQITQLLNGLVRNVDWKAMGQVVGNGLNVAFGAINTFFKNFDWVAVGKALADGLNGIIKNVNWKLIGETIGNYFNTKILTFHGFVKNFDWANLGHSIAEGLNSAVKTIDWGTLGSNVSDGIKGIFISISTFLKEVDWTQIGNKVAEFLNGIDWMGILYWVGEAIGDALIATIEIPKGIWDGLDGETKAFTATIGGVALAWKALEFASWAGQVGGLVKAFDLLVVAKLKDKAETIALHALYVKDFIVSIAKGTAEMVKQIAQWAILTAAKILDAIQTGIQTAATWLVNAAQTALNLVMSLNPIMLVVAAIAALIAIIVLCVTHWDEIKAVLEKVWAKLEETWGTVKEWFNEKVKKPFQEGLDKVKGFFNGIIDWVKDNWQGLLLLIVNPFAGAFKLLYENCEGFRNFIDDLWVKIKDGIKGAINGIIGFINGMIRGVVSGVNAVVRALNKIQVTLPDWVPEWGGRTIGFNLSEVNAPQIPLLAQGGYVGARNPQLAVIGDNTREGEIVAPESKIAEAVRKGIQEAGAAWQQAKEIVIKLVVSYPDGRKLIKVINAAQMEAGEILLEV